MSKKTSEWEEEARAKLSNFLGEYLVLDSVGRSNKKFPHKNAMALREVMFAEFIQFISSLLKEQRAELIDRIKALMPEKRAKELGDQLEMFRGERSCSLCGTNPELQRQMILDSLKERKK